MSFPTRVIRGLGEIAGRYDAFILDLWGCLHDGVTVYPMALEALKQLKSAGKRSIILSNAPRRASEVKARIGEMGITPDLYEFLHTSGEETWRELSQNEIEVLKGRGRRLYPIMPARDRAVIEGVTATLVDDPAEADFILVTGTETGQEELSSFDPVLAPAAKRGIPLVCANPDLVVHRGGVEEICAGSIAQRYEMLGGAVIWFGKPYPAVYRRILAECSLSSDHLLCIGDALRTDVAGGKAIGAATLFTVGGIHHQELLVDNQIDPARLEALCRRLGPTPDFAIAHLGW
ncbi:TIGR01459 family HAD-type hydrolase [Dongia deserti]|uniref:TIGR01459 family HAD-type hydrolase n=1 Tax=Dongia deserti TaxID=2268030 RepID=UPI000E64D0B5|nr:TIGR01459 family HAD-type hydrolase [Dongia deserti]